MAMKGMSNFILIIICLSSSAVLGTAQFTEKILFQGQEYSMMSTPLEDYFDINHPRPPWLVAHSTACWRGYIASWEIKYNHLFLKKIGLPYSVDTGKRSEMRLKPIPLEDIFPNARRHKMATWYTGVLRLPTGKLLQYVHMGFGSVYEKDIFLTIVKGKLVDTMIQDNHDKMCLSPIELSWRELGRMTPTGGQRTVTPMIDRLLEQGDWLDIAQLIDKWEEFATTKKIIKIRGSIHGKHLWNPPRAGISSYYIEINAFDSSTEWVDEGPVEVECRVPDDGFFLNVISVRPLQPGSAFQKRTACAPEK